MLSFQKQFDAQICLHHSMEESVKKETDQEIGQSIPATFTMSFLAIAQESVKMMDLGLEVLQLVQELSVPVFLTQPMDKSPSLLECS